MFRRINVRLLKRVAVVCAVLIGLVGIIGFFALPPLLKPFIISKVSQAIHREVSFDKLSFNPYTLSVTLRGLKIGDKGQPSTFFSFDELHLNLEGPASVVKRALILKEARIVRPFVHLVRRGDGTYNFTDLLPGAKEESPAEKKPFHFSVNNIRILDGSIDFEDGPVGARHTVRNLNLDIPFISNKGHAVDEYVTPKFSARINGQPYELAGKTKPFSATRETSFDFDVRGVDIPFYLKYVPLKLNCKLVSALLDARVSIRFLMPEGKNPSIHLGGRLALNKVALDDARGEKILRLPSLETEIASAEPLAGTIHLSRVALHSPELVLRKSREGEINLANLLAASPKKKTAAKPGPERKSPPGTGLKLRVDEFKIESADLAFMDGSLSEPAEVRIAPLNFRAANLSTDKGALGEVDLSLVLNRKGRLAAKGTFGLDPLSAVLDIEAGEIGVKPFQPYFTDFIRIAVVRGDLSASGRLTVAPGDKGKPMIRYTGAAAVSRLATVDKASAGRFLGWRQLHFDQVEAGFSPLLLHIKGVSLADFYARLAVDEKGTLNLRNVFAAKPEDSPTAQKPPAGPPVKAAAAGGPAPDIRIGKVTLQGGTIDFSDHYIKPNYSARMLNIGGSVTGLSSQEISRATVDLRGNLGAGSPIEITGRVNPLARDLFADIRLVFKDIELSPVTPYSSKFIGYPIVKGKLTFDVAYLIEKRKLDAKNRIFIDQLTFGERVESPDAIKAPVTIAVSLLSDRNGQINLDIPLSGSLDDPQFQIWPLVWKVIVNLITKAATAPFSLLASLVGGGEEMSYVEFDYGSDLIAPASEQKIGNLAKALVQRPALRLEIAGYADAERDTAGLKRAAIDRKIRAQKMKALMRKGGTASPDQVRVEPAEFNQYLKAAYEAEKFPKPRNLIGLAKGLAPEEMQKLMLAYEQVRPDDLRLLALRRAERVKEQVLKAGIQPGRIFVLEPHSLAPGKKDKVRESRVDFTLK